MARWSGLTLFPEWGPGPLGVSLQLSDFLTPGGRLTLEEKLRINRPRLSGTAVQPGPTFPLPALEITPQLTRVSTQPLTHKRRRDPLQSLLGLWAWGAQVKKPPTDPLASAFSVKECL